MRASIRYAVLIFAISGASMVGAVNIYDVIELSGQDYSDAEIIKLIRSTRSVFELSAEDVPRLKSLGVSETVIRAMLVAAPTAALQTEDLVGEPDNLTPAALTDSVSANDFDEDITPVVSDPVAEAHSSDHEHPTSPLLAPDWFDVQFVSEEKAGGHQHAYVTLTGVPILILRDEGRFQSIEDRGEAVARNLEEAATIGAGSFRAVHVNGEDVIVFTAAVGGDSPIVAVNGSDVQAYDVRSERHVTSDLLAQYWAALLDDYWSIAFRRQFPSQLVNLHRGDAFVLLFNLVNRLETDEPVNLGSVIQQLPGTIQGHLERLAQSVPEDFAESDEDGGDAL